MLITFMAFRFGLWFVVALSACDRGSSQPQAKGSLVFDERDAADVFLATEAEVMRTEPILREVQQRYRVELARSAVTVTRRTGTMILDVAVRDKDPQLAAELCNHLMQAYVESRLMRSQATILEKVQVLSTELDARKDPAIEQQIKDLEIKRRLLENDVRLLEPCRMPR